MTGYYFKVRNLGSGRSSWFRSTPIYDENVEAAKARLALTYTPDRFELIPDGREERT